MKAKNKTLMRVIEQTADYVYSFEGKDYIFKYNLVKLDSLMFWTDNPRTNLLHPPKSQDAFFDLFKNDSNVLDLQKKLRSQHQLEPLVIKKTAADNYIVFEGNSRLAAMKLINDELPHRFSEAKCYVAPERCPDKVLEAIVDERHGEDSPIKKWTPFGRGLHLANLLKKYKKLSVVSEIVHENPQEILICIKTSQVLIKATPKGQEPDKERFSAVKAVHSHFQRKTTLKRKQSYDGLIRVALDEKYGGFGTATAFRKEIPQIEKTSSSIIQKGIKMGTLPNILSDIPCKTFSDSRSGKSPVKKVPKKVKTPHFVRKAKNIHSDLHEFQQELFYSKKHEQNENLRKSVFSYVKRILDLAKAISSKLS